MCAVGVWQELELELEMKLRAYVEKQGMLHKMAKEF